MRRAGCRAGAAGASGPGVGRTGRDVDAAVHPPAMAWRRGFDRPGRPHRRARQPRDGGEVDDRSARCRRLVGDPRRGRMGRVRGRCVRRGPVRGLGRRLVVTWSQSGVERDRARCIRRERGATGFSLVGCGDVGCGQRDFGGRGAALRSASSLPSSQRSRPPATRPLGRPVRRILHVHCIGRRRPRLGLLAFGWRPHDRDIEIWSVVPGRGHRWLQDGPTVDLGRRVIRCGSVRRRATSCPAPPTRGSVDGEFGSLAFGRDEIDASRDRDRGADRWIRRREIDDVRIDDVRFRPTLWCRGTPHRVDQRLLPRPPRLRRTAAPRPARGRRGSLRRRRAAHAAQATRKKVIREEEPETDQCDDELVPRGGIVIHDGDPVLAQTHGRGSNGSGVAIGRRDPRGALAPSLPASVLGAADTRRAVHETPAHVV